MNTYQLISLVVLCDYIYTATIDKQNISVHNNGQEIVKSTRNKKTGMLEVPLDIQQSQAVTNNILAQTSKP